jgi:NADH:ubiquinone oxidoreductase subunit 2 (subunit N)
MGVSSGDVFGLQASFLFLFFYIGVSFVFFSVILHISDFTTGKEILFVNQLNRFGREHRELAFVLALCLFSMAGIPPLVGFFGKAFLFFSAYKAGNFGLVLLASVMNIISAFYYLRLVKCMFFERTQKDGKYLYFTGTGNFGPWLVDFIVFFFLALCFSPLLLKGMLIFFEQLSIGAFFVRFAV